MLKRRRTRSIKRRVKNNVERMRIIDTVSLTAGTQSNSVVFLCAELTSGAGGNVTFPQKLTNFKTIVNVLAGSGAGGGNVYWMLVKIPKGSNFPTIGAAGDNEFQNGDRSLVIDSGFYPAAYGDNTNLVPYKSEVALTHKFKGGDALYFSILSPDAGCAFTFEVDFTRVY